MKATVEELPESKVRMTVEVPSGDVRHAIDHAASDLAGSLKIPGFRKGKVPMPVLLARVGKERLYTEAVESHIGGWFRTALRGTTVRPATPPEYDYELPGSPSETFQFTVTVGVQEPPELPDWSTLEVPAADAEVPAELVDAELEVLRSTVADLAPVDGRPAREGDTVVVDLVSSDGEAQRDYVVELGSQRLLPEIEEGLVGRAAGGEKEIEYRLPDGGEARITASVKEVYEKVLPPVDDDLAKAASEFDSIAELREEIETRLGGQVEEQLESQFRTAALDALVDATELEVAAGLVETRTVELWNALVRSLERRGISPEVYVQLSGRTPQQIQADIEAEARQALAREIVLEAAADKLGLEVSDEDVDALIREQSEELGEDADEVIAQVRDAGRYEALRADLRLRAALDRIAAEVKRIPMELAEAREKLWTPEKEKPETATKLWTPGSKEPA
ncbi:MAG TPA: trigger factor [Gaiellaceae bacterium]|nr:trigger factor [Gaiellaceae bacterium]